MKKSPPPPPKKSKRPQAPTPEELAEWKKKNPGQMHPYWIERHRRFHEGDKSMLPKAQL